MRPPSEARGRPARTSRGISCQTSTAPRMTIKNFSKKMVIDRILLENDAITGEPAALLRRRLRGDREHQAGRRPGGGRGQRRGEQRIRPGRRVEAAEAPPGRRRRGDPRLSRRDPVRGSICWAADPTGIRGGVRWPSEPLDLKAGLRVLPPGRAPEPDVGPTTILVDPRFRARIPAPSRIASDDPRVSPGRLRAARERGRVGDLDLWRPPAAQRGRRDPRADDGPSGWLTAPRHQRGGFDPRLGICLARGGRPRGSRRTWPTAPSGPGDETSETHPPRPDGRRDRGAGLRGVARPD